MKRTKFYAILLGGLITAISFYGCGDSAPPQGQLPPQEEGKRSETISLTLWGTEEDAELLEELIAGFKAQYNSQTFNIAVEYQSEANCKDALFGKLIDGYGSDVFAFADDQLRVMVAAGMLAPVKDADTVRKNNVEAACEAASVNGVLYAYPMTADNGYFLYYNKAYLNEKNIESMDDLLRVAKANGKKFVMDWSSGWYLYSFFGGTGLSVGLSEDGVSNRCDWNATDTKITGMDVAKGMLAIAGSGALDPSGQFVDRVKDGTAIAGVSGVWDSVVISEVWKEHYGAAKLPTYTCGGSQVQMASFAGYKMVGVNAYSKQAEWAQKLADFITNEESQTLRFVRRGQGPSNILASSSNEIAASPAIKAILSQSEFSSLQSIGGSYWEPTQKFGELMAAKNPENRNLQDILDEMVKGITSLY